jgi:hypothetical protein
VIVYVSSPQAQHLPSSKENALFLTAVICGLFSSFSMMVGTTDSLDPEKYPLHAESNSTFSFMVGGKGNPYTVIGRSTIREYQLHPKTKIELTSVNRTYLVVNLLCPWQQDLLGSTGAVEPQGRRG